MNLRKKVQGTLKMSENFIKESRVPAGKSAPA
jgi:hypothetical protein